MTIKISESRGFAQSRSLSYSFEGQAQALDTLLSVGIPHNLGRVPDSLSLQVDQGSNWEQHDPATYVLTTSTTLEDTATTLASVLGATTMVKLVAATGAPAVSVQLASATQAGIVSTGAQSFAGVKTFAVDPAFTSGSQLVTTGAQTIAGAKTFTNALTVQYGGPGIILGADLNASTLTDATRKYGYISVPQYTNAEENVLLVQMETDTAFNVIRYGGGDASYNSATEHRWYTAATATTVTGTERMRLTSAGNVGIGTTNPVQARTVISKDQTDSSSAVFSNSHLRLIHNTVTNTTGVTALTASTGGSATDNYGISVGAQRYGATSAPKFFVRMHNNSDIGIEAITALETGAVTLGPNGFGGTHPVNGILAPTLGVSAGNAASSATNFTSDTRVNSYYEEGTQTGTVLNYIAGDTISYTLKLVRTGSLINLTWTFSNTNNVTKSGISNPSLNQTIPAAFRPTTGIFVPISITENNTRQVGYVFINSTGAVDFRVVSNGAWTSGANANSSTGTATYSI